MCTTGTDQQGTATVRTLYGSMAASTGGAAAALPAAGAQVELGGQHYDRYRDRLKGTHTHTSGVRPISGISL